MKNVKKLFSIVMVLAMVLSLGASALAATVKVEADGTSFSAWQVFAGSTDDTNPNAGAQGHLGDIVWGSAISDPSSFVAALKKDNADALKSTGLTANPFADLAEDASAKDVGAILNGVKDSAAVAEYFAQVAYEFLKNNTTKVTIGGEDTSADLPDGYYLIAEDGVGDDGVANPALLQLTDEGDVTIKKKADIPQVDKTVGDVNDSTGATGEGKSADYDIGDSVPYTLKATLGAGYEKFEKYYLEFHDVMSKGLTYNGDAKVYIGDPKDGGTLLADGVFTITSEMGAEGQTILTVKCKDTKAQDALKNLVSGSAIYVTYSATLNENAAIGVAGNPNTVDLVFSNNPNDNGAGTSKTEKVTAVVFTFDQKVNKTDSAGGALQGAEFKLVKLYKEYQGEGEAPTTEYSYEALKAAANGAWFKYGDSGYVKVVGAKETAGSATQFNFDGIDDGEYILVETQVPEGYNKADDIQFKVEATHDETGKLTGFTVSVKDGESYTALTGAEGEAFTVTKEPANADGMITGDVVNENGLELPETGGIGTTIFYVVGAVLVAGAVILLVTRKRVNGAEK